MSDLHAALRPVAQAMLRMSTRPSTSGAARAFLVHYNTRKEVREFGSALAEIRRLC